MKSLIYKFLLFIVFIFYAQSIVAQNYITVHYNDGTPDIRFYQMDVDSLVYSKKGIDNLEYNDWQVQEIWMNDSVCRIPLNVIDNISFTQPNIESVAESCAQITIKMEDLINQYHNIGDLSIHLDEIRNTNGVEDIWSDGTCIYIKIQDSGVLEYQFPLIDESYASQSRAQTIFKAIDNTKDHQHFEGKKVCIANQLLFDNRLNYFFNNRFKLKDYFERCGFTVTDENPDLNFYKNRIFNYDIVFLITHGGYTDGKHWLMTNEPLDFSNNEKSRKELFEKYLKDKYNTKYSDNEVFWGGVSDESGIKYFVKVSEDYINSTSNRFKNNTIIYNTACKSMEGGEQRETLNGENVNNVGYGLSHSFLRKGAGVYFGYTDVQYITKACNDGQILFCSLLEGKSIGDSFYPMNKENHIDLIKNEETYHYYPVLVGAINSGTGKAIESLCILSPQTEGFEDLSEGMNLEVKLSASMKKYDLNTKGLELGFCVSTIQGEYGEPQKAELTKDEQNHMLLISLTLPDEELKSETNYYYCVYLYDGNRYCYGEQKSFTTHKRTGIAVTTYDATEAIGDYVVLNGEITSPDGARFAGFVVSPTPDFKEYYTVECDELSFNNNSLSISSELYGTFPGYTYYYKAFVYAHNEFFFGNTKTFKTTNGVAGDIKGFHQIDNAYVVEENGEEYVYFILDMDVSIKTNHSLDQWGVYVENYNNIDLYYWTISDTEKKKINDFRILCKVKRNWFDNISYSDREAKKVLKIGIYKVVNYNTGKYTLFGETKDFIIEYKQRPSAMFSSATIGETVETGIKDGLMNYSTEIYFEYDVKGGFWIKELFLNELTDDINNKTNPWTIGSDGHYYGGFKMEYDEKSYLSARMRISMKMYDGSIESSSPMLHFGGNNIIDYVYISSNWSRLKNEKKDHSDKKRPMISIENKNRYGNLLLKQNYVSGNMGLSRYNFNQEIKEEDLLQNLFISK
jgi:hypothetical protein